MCVFDTRLHTYNIRTHAHSPKGGEGLGAIGGGDGGEVLLDDFLGELLEGRLGGDTLDGDDALRVLCLGPPLGAHLVRFLDQSAGQKPDVYRGVIRAQRDEDASVS